MKPAGLSAVSPVTLPLHYSDIIVTLLFHHRYITVSITVTIPLHYRYRYDPAKPAGLSAVSPLASGLSERAVLTLRGTNLAPTPRLACSFEDHAGGFSEASPCFMAVT